MNDTDSRYDVKKHEIVGERDVVVVFSEKVLQRI